MTRKFIHFRPVLERQVFVLDRWVFVLDQWVFLLDWWVFVLDQWVFVLDHWVFVLDHWVFVLDQWVVVLDHRVFGFQHLFSTHPQEHNIMSQARAQTWTAGHKLTGKLNYLICSLQGLGADMKKKLESLMRT